MGVLKERASSLWYHDLDHIPRPAVKAVPNPGTDQLIEVVFVWQYDTGNNIFEKYRVIWQVRTQKFEIASQCYNPRGGGCEDSLRHERSWDWYHLTEDLLYHTFKMYGEQEEYQQVPIPDMIETYIPRPVFAPWEDPVWDLNLTYRAS